MSDFSIQSLKLNDLISILDDLSVESYVDVEVFNSSKDELIDKVLDAYPFAWTIHCNEEPKCVCWYNVTVDMVAQTSMLYSKDFLQNKGITPVVKKLVDDNCLIAKEGGVKVVEIHSTLSHPLSEMWYNKLSFSKTDRTYLMGDKTISIFERRL